MRGNGMIEERPTRGEVWIVRLPRGVGAELQRDRPCVVVSSSELDWLPVRFIVPMSSWRPEFRGRRNKVRVEASAQNGLHNDSAADVFQLRSVSNERFLEQIGVIGSELVEQIVASVVSALGYRPDHDQ